MGDEQTPTPPAPPEEKPPPAKEVGLARVTFYDDGSAVFIPSFRLETPGKVIERCLRVLGENMLLSALGFAAAHEAFRVQSQGVKEVGH